MDTEHNKTDFNIVTCKILYYLKITVNFVSTNNTKSGYKSTSLIHDQGTRN